MTAIATFILTKNAKKQKKNVYDSSYKSVFLLLFFLTFCTPLNQPLGIRVLMTAYDHYLYT